MSLAARRITCTTVLVLMMVSIVFTPNPARAGDAGEELKQIEYRYYFRGRYQQAIEALQTLLARVDLTPAQGTRAREVLAASYILGGAPAMGKELFSQIIAADPSYPGPDPSVFKLEVVNVCAQARAEYTARTLKSVPALDPALNASGDDDDPRAAAAAPKRPIYKKWWLYAGAAAALIVVGAAAGGDGDDTGSIADKGEVVVGVRIH